MDSEAELLERHRPGETSVIYVLRDPRDNAVRYVGQTRTTLSKRFGRHLKYRGRQHCSCWIASIQEIGLKPVIEPVDVVPFEQSNEAEIRWIANFRSLGADLTNLNDGGRCNLNLSQISRQRISEAMKGKPKTPEHARAISAGKKGKPKSADFVARMSAARMGKPGTPHTPESRAKISAARRGMKFTDEHRRNLSLAHLGQKPAPRTPEGRARLIAASRNRVISDETRRRMSEAHRGKTLPLEQRQKMSESHKRRQAEIRRSHAVK